MKRKETRETQILRSARKKSGLSQLQLATELDVQVRQYQRLEYGEQPFSTVNIRLGLKICHILQIDPYDLVLGEKSNLNPNMQLQSKPPGKKNYDSWNGHGAYPDPTANQAIYNVSVEWNRLRRLAIRLRLNSEEPPPELFTGIFRRLLTDVLLVFMFDRLGRRDDETPFVVQWFVQQGIEVWSAREGEQRFDNHVDKLLNYIRFWQASGESEKTAIRVRTRHSQMVQDGQWRGGLVAYGYRLEFQGRTNKKGQPVRDLVIDEAEAAVVRDIFRLITVEGYGTNKVASQLNLRGIKTKRGTTLWRGTSIRAIISNPIYKGVLRFGEELSPPIERLRIVSDEEFDCCEALVKGRAPERPEKPVEPIQQGSRNLLTGLIFCGYCGNRLCYSHNKTHRKLADGTEKVYDRHLYRCYRRISSPTSCEGPSAYEMDPINEAVEVAVRDYLNRISIIPREDLIALAGIREVKVAEVNYKQAVSEFNDAQRQVDALEAEALKALTGENQLDLSVVNSMLLKQKARMDAAAKKKEEAKVLLEMEKNNKKANEVQVDEILSWASRFDDASYEAKHLVIAQLVDRIEIRKNDGYDITIHWRMTAEQFLGRKKEESA